MFDWTRDKRSAQGQQIHSFDYRPVRGTAPTDGHARWPWASAPWPGSRPQRDERFAGDGPCVEIAPTPLAVLQAYVAECTGEVSGFGRIRVVPAWNRLIIEDLCIAGQQSSPAHTEISSDDLALFLDETLDRGEDTGLWRLYWHSHGDLDVFWSGEDIATMGTGLLQTSWWVSLVTNRAGDFKACLILREPLVLRLHDLPVVLPLDPASALSAQVRDEVRRKVRSDPGTKVPAGETPPGGARPSIRVQMGLHAVHVPVAASRPEPELSDAPTAQ